MWSFICYLFNGLFSGPSARAAPGLLFPALASRCKTLALIVAPTLLIVWPIVLYILLLKDCGIDDFDYFEDD